MTDKIQTKIDSSNSALYAVLFDKLSVLPEKKEFDDQDIALIELFKDLIQAKTFKYITPERLQAIQAIDIPAYIVTKCTTSNNANNKIQFGIVSSKLLRLQNDRASLAAYRRQQEDMEDYF